MKWINFYKHTVFQKLNQEAAESLNRLVSTSEIEALVKNLPAHEALDQMASLANFTKDLAKS